MRKTVYLTLLSVLLLVGCKQENKLPADALAEPAAETPAKAARMSIGSKLYVHAPSGLVLRKTPAKDGEKVITVPCNAQPLTVLAMPDQVNRYVAEKFGDFEVAGGWVKVRTEEGREGFLFEGYLSPYPPMVKAPENADSYLEWFYQSVSPLKGERIKLPAEPGLIEGYKQAFEDRAIFQFEYYEGGVTHHFYIPESKMTMQEALVLFRPLWFQGSATKGEYDAATQTLTIALADEYAQMSIQPKDGQLVLEFSSAD